METSDHDIDIEAGQAAAGEPAPQEEAATDELSELRAQLEQAQAQQAEYLDGWQRARAELANARKRFQRDQEMAYSHARSDVLVRLMPILDDFRRALENAPADVAEAGWLEGVRLIEHKFEHLLEQEGVSAIQAAGQEFDPYLHQAVTHEPSDEVPAGHVIAEMQRGYRLGEQVLRPSIVRVSSGPAPRANGDEAHTAEEA